MWLALADRVVVIGDFGRRTLNDWLWTAAIDRLMHHTFLPVLPVAAILTFLALLTLLALLALLTSWRWDSWRSGTS